MEKFLKKNRPFRFIQINEKVYVSFNIILISERVKQFKKPLYCKASLNFGYYSHSTHWSFITLFSLYFYNYIILISYFYLIYFYFQIFLYSNCTQYNFDNVVIIIFMILFDISRTLSRFNILFNLLPLYKSNYKLYNIVNNIIYCILYVIIIYLL